MRVDAPISFWGGIDPDSAVVSDPRHPNHGARIHNRILALPTTIGSSSSSAVLLELLRKGIAPAALLLSSIDAILVLGVIVARELGYPTIPVLQIPAAQLASVPQDVEARITDEGRFIWDG
jgi:predicted aconitase with swiveling domain